MTMHTTALYSPRPNHFITDTHTLGLTASNWPVRLTVPGMPPRTLRRLTPIYDRGRLLGYRYASPRGDTTLTVYAE